MHEQIIVIFNQSWQAIALVTPPKTETTPMCVEQERTLISWVLKQLEDRDPQLFEPVKDETGCIVGFQTVGKGEARYAEAVRDELKRVGLRAHIVDGSLWSLFVEISQENFAAVRAQVVPEVLGLDKEHARAALEAVLGTAST